MERVVKVGTWGVREGENTIQTKAGVQALSVTKQARLENTRANRQKPESQPEEEGRALYSLSLSMQRDLFPAPLRMVIFMSIFFPILLLCEHA